MVSRRKALWKIEKVAEKLGFGVVQWALWYMFDFFVFLSLALSQNILGQNPIMLHSDLVMAHPLDICPTGTIHLKK